MSNAQEIRKIRLSTGETLEVSMNPGFLERVSAYFNLISKKNVTDDHIRLYIFDVFKQAIDKAEYEGTRASST